MNTTKSDIDTNDQYAKEIIKEQKENARDYLNKYGFIQRIQKTVDFPSSLDEELTKEIEAHPFFCWLHEQNYFLQACDKLKKAKMFFSHTSKSNKSYTEKLILAGFCALLIHSFSRSKQILPQVVVSQKEYAPVKTSMTKLKSLLNRGGLYFSNGAKQLVFEALLKDLLKNEKPNVFSAQRSHSNLLRQAFIKILLQNLVRTYEKITVELAVNVTLDIADIFFKQSMDKRDAEREAQNILETVYAENKFLELTAMEIMQGR
jgi:hypothetical protein